MRPYVHERIFIPHPIPPLSTSSQLSQGPRVVLSIPRLVGDISIIYTGMDNVDLMHQLDLGEVLPNMRVDAVKVDAILIVWIWILMD